MLLAFYLVGIECVAVPWLHRLLISVYNLCIRPCFTCSISCSNGHCVP